MDAMSTQFDSRIRDRGLKVTASRLAVLRAVDELGGHPDAAAIAIHARERLGSVSTQAIYDGLHALEGAGLLRRIAPAGSPARYETRVGDNHHHLVCRSCGAAEDVVCAKGETPCLHPVDDNGFVIDEAEVIYWGLCASCTRAQAA
jgi:Fur family ferric uptake transcriptional regulator